MGLLLKRALDQAAVWHKDQRRKYPGADVPYMSHLAGVAAVLARHGFDEEVVAAGALHDALEDTEATYDEVEKRFGPRLADKIDNFWSIVVCAKDHGDPWAQFKRGRDAQLQRFDALLEGARALPAHPLVDEYRAALDEVRKL